jgi:two-component system OmpR family sensor kinase/two-component system sensor histidine kinase BaeS
MINLPERSPLFLPFGIGRPFFPLWGIIPVVLIALGLLTAARALRGATMPIGDLMEAAGRVAEGDYAARVPERGPGEVRALSNAFNQMTTRLQLNDEQRRKLLADISHELRTPLTVIQGNLEGLMDGVYPRDDAHLTAILEETRLMARLIDDLRTLALAEAGALKLQRVPTDVAALINDTLNSFRPQADTAGIHLRSEIAGDLPIVEIDSARIREVLENLITNALHFTPNGGEIRVGVSRNDQRMELWVSDTGAGVSREDLPHIFDRFYKSRESRGTGLGLAIAKDLITAHGGDISAQSDSGHGTTIRFTLPL